MKIPMYNSPPPVIFSGNLTMNYDQLLEKQRKQKQIQKQRIRAISAQSEMKISQNINIHDNHNVNHKQLQNIALFTEKYKDLIEKQQPMMERDNTRRQTMMNALKVKASDNSIKNIDNYNKMPPILELDEKIIDERRYSYDHSVQFSITSDTDAICCLSSDEESEDNKKIRIKPLCVPNNDGEDDKIIFLKIENKKSCSSIINYKSSSSVNLTPRPDSANIDPYDFLDGDGYDNKARTSLPRFSLL